MGKTTRNSASRGSGARPAYRQRRGQSSSRTTGRPSSQGPVNLWPRRIITGTALLLIIAVVVWAVVALVGRLTAGAGNAQESQRQAAAQSGMQSGAQSASQSGASSGHSAASDGYVVAQGQEATADGLLNPDDSVDIPQCTQRSLDVSVAATGTTVGAGEALSVKLLNRSDVSCVAYLGALTVEVHSGDQVVYDSSVCAERDPKATALLLAPDKEWQGTVSWDGKVYVNGCDAPAGGLATAQAGTYWAQLSFDGKTVGSPQWFEVNG
ncbi:hypothetical protein [Schaalia sp. ZJ1691]|uniref:hypothetical protein n=1 Tax=Schaalia sp. ZJ1691 TaxID=2709404 RepID=UPI0013ECD394|nr:hypothetical protein [Schaalia sp. ZJ1691]